MKYLVVTIFSLTLYSFSTITLNPHTNDDGFPTLWKTENDKRA